ncbi:hypothetical protein IE4771_CH01957 [Rhizobium etli bv. mimosae str. IE4771]|uniref:Uncharacterized protein n=1 Tax=Rhizobium etli bv. mimosae str. IE4771 TaxID=1432050 RepID=A0A060I041_RHIET|nr:hypothetical protein [Rhizobium sp. IE4771]AIC27074.1 hypothetical protein IE4771_CH01957 [Rhizobium sp. IE4771]
MTSGKQRGYAFDVDAWIQFHLLRLATFHPDTTKADLAVLAEIIQRYFGKFGNGWVTHEALGEIAGISKATVIRAKRNLEHLGFITVIQPGRRGSATVYKPNFDLVPRKGVTDDTETKGITHDTETAAIGCMDATETAEYGSTDDTPSYLPDRPTRAESQIDRIEFAAPVAPPLAGPSAATAEPANEGSFEELWRAYDHKRKKAEAKAAYAKLAPNPELHAKMVDAAGKWFARWAAQEKTDAPRFTLAKWIEREEYECEPPTAYKTKDRKAASEPKPKPTVRPRGPRVVDIHDADLDVSEPGSQVLVLIFSERDKPITWRHRIILEDKSMDRQQAGQKEFVQLVNALGLAGVTDTAELCGHPVTITEHAEGLQYAPAIDHKEAA